MKTSTASTCRCVEKRAQDLPAPFDQDVGHLARRELFEQRHDRDAGRTWKRDHFAAMFSQARSASNGRPSLVTATSTGHSAAVWTRRHDSGNGAAAVEHDASRRYADPGGRAVKQGSSASTVPMPDDDRVHPAAQLVYQPP